jgi:Xaa-Pro aminopeptidase
MNVYGKVIPYDQSIEPLLIEELHRLDPKRIAINYSQNDVLADGLSLGMYQLLCNYLEGTPYKARLESAEKIHSALRGRKTPREIQLIKNAIRTTQLIYQQTFDFIKIGMSEAEVSEYMHTQLDEFGVEAAWEYDECPIVNTGPESSVGHIGPTKLEISPGHIVHIDFGVKQEEYCSDIQRVIYMHRPGEFSPPTEVQRGFDTVREAIEHVMEAMKPGVKGEIDQIMTNNERRIPEYLYATGHQLGRLATMSWYSGTSGIAMISNYLLEEARCLQLNLDWLPGYGYIGLEEDVLVTTNGGEYLGDPQKEHHQIEIRSE